MNDKIPESWLNKYDQARKYYEENGNLLVKKNDIRWTGLGNWISNQRSVYNGSRNRKLSGEQIALLEEIGMVWDANKYKWLECYQLLLDYKEQFHDTLIPAEYKMDGVGIGKWLAEQRERYRKEKLSKERIELLEGAGVIWNVFDEIWMENYELAKGYYEENGDLDIAEGCKCGNVDLGRWIQRQRKFYQNGHLSKRKIQLLGDIGIAWKPLEDNWNKYYGLAERVFEERGNINIPARKYVDGLPLGRWIAEQRRYCNCGKLKPERKKKLERLNINWSLGKSRRSTSFQQKAIEYYVRQIYQDTLGDYNELGYELDIFVPSLKIGIEYDGAPWHKNKMTDIKKNRKCSADNVRLIRVRENGCPVLNDTSMDIGLRDDTENALEEAIRQILDLLKSHAGGTVRKKAKIRDPQDVNIALHRKAIYDLLENSESWNRSYVEAKKFYIRNNHLRVPRNYMANNVSLGEWVSNQRRLKKCNKLSEYQISLLNDIGICWEINNEIWMEKYLKLKKYHECHRTLRIPYDYVDEGCYLARWLKFQKHQYHKLGRDGKSALTEERIKLLSEIDSGWWK